LLQLGIDVGESGADSKYATDTETPLKDFQRQTGISMPDQDGIVGSKTLWLLDMSVRNDAVSSDTDKEEED
jgi:murein L,D-transpeptidase YcbB/YkuD